MLGKHPQVTVQIEANLQWMVARDPQSGLWIAVCPPLNLNAMGETWGEVLQAANEAVLLLMCDLFEEGELESFLQQHSWRADKPLPPKSARPRFDVPFSMERSDISQIAALN